jgi:hypothetical protein
MFTPEEWRLTTRSKIHKTEILISFSFPLSQSFKNGNSAKNDMERE